MLIGIIVGPTGNGVEAVLFYLLAYGVMNTAAFGVLAGLERKGREIDSMDDLAGLRVRHPLMAAALAIAAGSLLGIPPLLGFWSKLYIFMAGVEGNQIPLVVIACINSAISAWYYLRFVALPVITKPSAQSDTVVAAPVVWPRVAAVVTAMGVLLLPVFAQQLVNASRAATDQYLTGAPATGARAASVETAP
jgi:NADH-quinone oxidoreductase subunit N